MQKIYKFILLISLIGLQETAMQAAKKIIQQNVIVADNFGLYETNAKESYIKDILKQKPETEQEFIAENGTMGIYQPGYGKAYIGDDSYEKVTATLITSPDKKIKKPWRKSYLGVLIDGDKKYRLYGRDSDPAPVNDGPDSDVRTEQKLGEDFGRNFGSGHYTPNDKWD
jgi:hypothetical protein